MNGADPFFLVNVPEHRAERRSSEAKDGNFQPCFAEFSVFHGFLRTPFSLAWEVKAFAPSLRHTPIPCYDNDLSCNFYFISYNKSKNSAH
jgi:hypothetical protein